MSRRAGFTGLLTAEVVSLLGSRMTFVALPWLVLVTTGSATRTGMVAFAEMLPYVLVCAAGGPLIDRIGPRLTSIGMDVASLFAVGAVPLLHGTHHLSFTALVALVAVAGAIRGIGDTAKQVIFPVVVATSGVAMTRATSLQDGLARGASLVGAPVAGLLVAALDAPSVLLIDAASFGVAAVLIGLLVPVRVVEPPHSTGPGARAGLDGPTAAPGSAEVADPVSEPGTTPREPYLAQLRAGVTFLKQDRLILGIVLMFFATNLFDQAYTTVFVPVWAREVFGSPVGIGLVSAAFALGAVLGNIAYTVLASRLPRFAPFAIGLLLGGAPRFLVMATHSPLRTVLAVAFAAGVGLSVINPILGAVTYERIPARLQARVLGLATAASWAGIPLGSLFGGVLADGPGLRTGLVITGGLYLLATLAPFVGRQWRQLDRPVALATSG